MPEKPPRASIGLDLPEPQASAGAGIGVDVGQARRTGTAINGEGRAGGIAIDESESRPAGIAVEFHAHQAGGIAIDDGSGATGIALDAPSPSEGPTLFHKPMPIRQAQAEQIASGSLSTARVLGLKDPAALLDGRISPGAASAQVAAFLEQLDAFDKQYADTHLAPTELPDYGSWLQSIRQIRRAQDAAKALHALLEGEREKCGLAQLRQSAATYLIDGVLEWAEHQKMLWEAERLGLTPAHVEQVYGEFPAFRRESEQEAAQSARTGWKPHPKLARKGEGWGWSLGRLQDAMEQQFEVALEIANLGFEHKFSLYAYLEDKEEDAAVAAREAALQAREAARQTGCLELAVWNFLWASGRPALHLTGAGHRPAAERRRQVSSLEELGRLLASEWVMDELVATLEGGLLERWLEVVGHQNQAAVLAAELRQAAKRVVESKRPAFLRSSVARVLWKAGFDDLLLCDSAGHVRQVGDPDALVAHADDCWSMLDEYLAQGALTDWLLQRDPSAKPQHRLVTAAQTAAKDDGDRARHKRAPLARVLWKLGYTKLRISRRSAESANDIIDICDGDPQKLTSVVNSGELADWCDDVLQCPDLAEVVRGSFGKGAAVVPAQNWLWLAGEDRLWLEEQGPLSTPEQVATFSAEKRANIGLVLSAIESGTLAAWIEGLLKRGKILAGARRALADASAHPSERSAYTLMFSWGPPVLPLFGVDGVQVDSARGLRDILRLRADDPHLLVSAIESGAYQALYWHHPRHKDAVRLDDDWGAIDTFFGDIPHAAWPDAACWLLGNRTLLLANGAELATTADLFAAVETAPEVLADAYGGGVLQAWLSHCTIVEPDTLRQAADAAKAYARGGDLIVFAWGLGYRKLPLGGSAVASPQEFVAVADTCPEQVDFLLNSGLLVAWLSSHWPDVSTRVQEKVSTNVANSSPHTREDVLVLLGAKQPVVSIEPVRFDIKEVEEGATRSASFRLTATACRGYAYGTLSATRSAFDEHGLLKKSGDRRLTFLSKGESGTSNVGMADFCLQNGSHLEIPFVVATQVGKHLRGAPMPIAIEMNCPPHSVELPVCVTTVYPWKAVGKTAALWGSLAAGLLLGLRLLAMAVLPGSPGTAFASEYSLAVHNTTDGGAIDGLLMPFVLLGLLLLVLWQPWIRDPEERRGLLWQRVAHWLWSPARSGGWFLLLAAVGVYLATIWLCVANRLFFSLAAHMDAFASGTTRGWFGTSLSRGALTTSWLLLVIPLGIAFGGWAGLRKYHRGAQGVLLALVSVACLYAISARGTSTFEYVATVKTLTNISSSGLKRYLQHPVLGKWASGRYLASAVREGRDCLQLVSQCRKAGVVPGGYPNAQTAQMQCAINSKDPVVIDTVFRAAREVLKAKHAPDGEVRDLYDRVIGLFQAVGHGQLAAKWALDGARQFSGSAASLAWRRDRLLLGGSILWSGRSPEAERVFSKALKLDPKGTLADRRFQSYLKDVKRRLKKLRKPRVGRRPPVRPTITADSDAANARKAAAAQVATGRAQLRRGSHSKARDAFLEALKLNPKSAAARGGLGEIAFELGNYAAASAHLSRALRLNPRNGRYLVMLGNVYFKQGKNAAAVEQYRRALRINGKNREARSGLDAALRRMSRGS